MIPRRWGIGAAASRAAGAGLPGTGRLLHDTRAVAAVEMGVVLGFVVALIAGIVGVGQALSIQYRVDRATHTALLYGWGNPTGAATASNLVNAGQAGYGPAGPTATITASMACYCLDQTGKRTSGTTTSVACTGSCSTAGQVLGKWVTVSSSAAFTPVFIGAWNGSAWTLQNSSTVRVQ